MAPPPAAPSTTEEEELDLLLARKKDGGNKEEEKKKKEKNPPRLSTKHLARALPYLSVPFRSQRRGFPATRDLRARVDSAPQS